MSEETVQLHSELSEMRTALFGNALRGDVGLVRNVARMEKVLDDVARDQGELRGGLEFKEVDLDRAAVEREAVSTTRARLACACALVIFIAA